MSGVVLKSVCELQSELHQIDERRGIQTFLARDELNTSDPIRKPINRVWDAWSAFTGSTYPKASNIDVSSGDPQHFAKGGPDNAPARMKKMTRIVKFVN